VQILLLPVQDVQCGSWGDSSLLHKTSSRAPGDARLGPRWLPAVGQDSTWGGSLSTYWPWAPFCHQVELPSWWAQCRGGLWLGPLQQCTWAWPSSQVPVHPQVRDFAIFNKICFIYKFTSWETSSSWNVDICNFFQYKASLIPVINLREFQI